MVLGRVIVVPLASPDTAAWLGRLAALLARPDEGLVVPVSVVTPDMSPDLADQARLAVARAEEAAAAHGVAVRGRVVTGQRVPTAVLDAVDDDDASLVLMGWQGQTTAHNVFGELIDSVMGRSSVPLAVVRPALDPVDRVLLPVSDDHLGEGGRRGINLAAQIADRLRKATEANLVIVRSGERTDPLPEDLRELGAATLRLEGTVAEGVAHIARASDIIVTPVAPTGDGLRNATTHLAWATPRSWQLVAIDVGPPAEVDIVSAVKDAGMLVEPTPDPEEDTPHLVEVSVTVTEDAEDPWSRIKTAVRMVGTVTHHRRQRDEAGHVVNIGHVEVLATSAAAALSAIMVELDDARWHIAPVELTYGLVTDRSADADADS
ncbi:MAG TPA: universal stress protein [Euzebya sp.]|nr:universal stress protein [Euzebya sp.]